MWLQLFVVKSQLIFLGLSIPKTVDSMLSLSLFPFPFIFSFYLSLFFLVLSLSFGFQVRNPCFFPRWKSFHWMPFLDVTMNIHILQTRNYDNSEIPICCFYEEKKNYFRNFHVKIHLHWDHASFKVTRSRIFSYSNTTFLLTLTSITIKETYICTYVKLTWLQWRLPHQSAGRLAP